MHRSTTAPNNAPAGGLSLWLAELRHHRFALLLASLLLLLILSPLLEGDATGNVLLTLLFTMVLLAAVVAASERRLTLGIALAFALPWVTLSWLRPLWQGDATELIADLLLIGLGLFTLALVLGRVVSARQVGIDTLCGAIAVYLLIGVVWAVCYGVIEMLNPGSFGFADRDFEMVWTQLLYFSLVTLSTLGYGDITPLGAIARVWSALEAVTGTLYLTVLIARLVGLYRT